MQLQFQVFGNSRKKERKNELQCAHSHKNEKCENELQTVLPNTPTWISALHPRARLLHGVRVQKLVSDVSSIEICDRTKFFMSGVIGLHFFHHFRDRTSIVFHDFLRSEFTFQLSTVISPYFHRFWGWTCLHFEIGLHSLSDLRLRRRPISKTVKMGR